MKKWRKGELKFLKGSTPKELTAYMKEHPTNKPYVDQFLSLYTYNFVKKVWVKKDDVKIVMARMKGEM